MKVLHVCSELYPLLKTGGLADVLGALPAAQKSVGIDGVGFSPRQWRDPG